MYVPRGMIAALIFVLAFITLGLTVVFLAFTSGPAGARLRQRATSRRGRRLLGVLVAIVIVGLGVAVPLAIGVANSNHHAENAPGGVDLNASQTAGRVVFAKNCATCHTLKASNAVGRVGPNLDDAAPEQGVDPGRDRPRPRQGAGSDAGGRGPGRGRPERGELRLEQCAGRG